MSAEVTTQQHANPHVNNTMTLSRSTKHELQNPRKECSTNHGESANTPSPTMCCSQINGTHNAAKTQTTTVRCAQQRHWGGVYGAEC